MRPGPLMFPLLAMCLAIALLAPWLPLAAYVSAAMLLLVLSLALIERVLVGRIVFRSERPPISALSLNEIEKLSLSVFSNSSRSLQMALRQNWPQLIEARSSRRQGVCPPGAALRFEFDVRGIERGRATLPAPHVAVSLWGFSERLAPIGENAELNVLPNLRAVARLHRQLNQYVLRGMGTRISPKLGKGREFERLREYHNDDDFRDIAWKSSARHNKLIVREFRTDRSQDILVCIDRGHRMAARSGHISKADHAVNASVLLAYICNRMEDRMGLLSFGAEVERGVGQGRGSAHGRQLTAFATGLKAQFIHTDYMALAAHVRRRLRQRSLILIMTDLPESGGRQALVRAVRMLLPQHLPLVLIFSDPALEAAARFKPADKAGLCRTLVAHDVWLERKHTILELKRLGAMVVDSRPEDAGLDAINAYIDIKRRQLI